MRSVYSILVVAALASGATCAEAQNVSVNAVISGQVVPGVYGQVVIGNAAPPPVVYPQPVVVEPPPVVVGAPPVAGRWVIRHGTVCALGEFWGSSLPLTGTHPGAGGPRGARASWPGVVCC